MPVLRQICRILLTLYRHQYIQDNSQHRTAACCIAASSLEATASRIFFVSTTVSNSLFFVLVSLVEEILSKNKFTILTLEILVIVKFMLDQYLINIPHYLKLI